MRDFDRNRSNTIVVINSTLGLRQCVHAILEETEPVNVEDLHIYVSKKVSRAVLTEQIRLVVPEPVEKGVLSEDDENAVAKLFEDIKSAGKTRFMWYVRVPRADMRKIYAKLAEAAEVPVRQLVKLPWYAYRLC